MRIQGTDMNATVLNLNLSPNPNLSMKPQHPLPKRSGISVDQFVRGPFRLFSHAATLAAVLLVVFLWPITPVTAELSEPDNIIYGTLTLDNAPVTAARTDVVVEARRLANGPVIAFYRMGSSPQLGNFYSLRLLLESVPPASDPGASQVGDSVFIVVRDASGPRGQANYSIAERGQVQRVDFGPAVNDGDSDGLPDAWELLHFANLDANSSSVGANGGTALQNFIAGTDPNDTTGAFRLSVALSNSQKRVSFVAVRAEGPGYEGMTRLYTLESSPNFAAASWTGVANYTDLPGNNQTVLYQTAGLGAPDFFRGKILLQGYAGSGADSDSDGLPDVWETIHFGDLRQNAAALNANRQTAFHNYVAGTDPNDTDSKFWLNVTLNSNQKQVSFLARRAQGIGYEGKTRYYALESSTSLNGSPWIGLGGFTNVLGNNQTVTYQTSITNPPAFYRGRVALQGP